MEALGCKSFRWDAFIGAADAMLRLVRYAKL
jgi:hypothetical protein